MSRKTRDCHQHFSTRRRLHSYGSYEASKAFTSQYAQAISPYGPTDSSPARSQPAFRVDKRGALSRIWRKFITGNDSLLKIQDEALHFTFGGNQSVPTNTGLLESISTETLFGTMTANKQGAQFIRRIVHRIDKTREHFAKHLTQSVLISKVKYGLYVYLPNRQS